MASSYLTAGNSPEELDKLIQSFEYENQHIVKVIEKENQLLEALDKDISEKKDSIRQLQESTSQLDEETKRAHKQFIQNRDNCESLRKTASVLFDHEVALMKKLNSVVVIGNQERNDRKNVLQHYIAIWKDYKAKYESFPLAKRYAEKKHQLDESSVELQRAAQQIQKLKENISCVKGTDIDVYDMKKFVVAVAEVKVDTKKNNLKISAMAEAKERLEMTLKEIYRKKVKAAEEEKRKAEALEEQRQKDLLETSKSSKTPVIRETGPEVDGNSDHQTKNIPIQMNTPRNKALVESQVSRSTPQTFPTLDLFMCNNPERSTLAHMCGKEQSLGLSAQPQSLTMLQQSQSRSVPVNRPQTPTPTATSQRNLANQQAIYQSRVTVANPAQMKHAFNGVNRGASNPQEITAPNYLIQPPSTLSTNTQGTSAKQRPLCFDPQTLAGRQLNQGRHLSVPTFKHPSQLETAAARVSPPRSILDNSQHAHSEYAPSDFQIETQSQPNSTVQNKERKSHTGPLVQTASHLPPPANRHLLQVYPQSGKQLPVIQPKPACRQTDQPAIVQPPRVNQQLDNRPQVNSEPENRQQQQGHVAQTSKYMYQKTPSSQAQVQASQQVSYTAHPNSTMGKIPTSTPITPDRQINVTSREATQRTPEHLRASFETDMSHGNPSTSPFDLERHLERVRLLTKSPGGPEYVTRPMFGSEQQENKTADVQQETVEDSPFIQSFFPDGRGDGKLFQSNFSSPALGETAGKSFFGNSGSVLGESSGASLFRNPGSPDPSAGQSHGGMSFDFSGGGDTQAPVGMFSLFGGPGEEPSNSAKNSDSFSFNFGGSCGASPTVNPSSGFSLF